MASDRAIAPVVLTGIVVVIAKQWPQYLWGWIYSHVHINNVGLLSQSNTSGQLTNPNAPASPYGTIQTPYGTVNKPAPGTYSTPL